MSQKDKKQNIEQSSHKEARTMRKLVRPYKWSSEFLKKNLKA